MANKILGLLLSYTTFAAFRFSSSVAIPEISKEFELKSIEIGLIFTIMFLFMAITMALVGKLSLRFGENKITFYGSLIVALSILAFYFTPSYISLLIFSALLGFGNGLMVPSVYSTLGQWKPKFRGLMLGLANTVYSIGGIAGSMITGLTTIIYGWRFSFLTYGLFGLAAPLLLFNPSFNSKVKTLRPKISYSSLFKRKSFLKAYIGVFFANIPFLIIVTWYPLYLEDIGVSIPEIGLTFTLFSLFGAIGSLFIGGISDRFSKDKTILLTALIAAISSIYFVIAPHELIVVFFLSSVLGFTNFAFWPLFLSLAQSSVSKEESIAATGLIQNSAIIAAMIAPVAIGALIPLLSLKLSLLISVPLTLLLTMLTILLLKDDKS
ncbi:MAG: MFS transporter [Nitrososphaerales archaeon]